MIIRRLTAKRFKRFGELETSAGPGINIIKGPNEAGKSTVHAAIQTCLFENAKSSNRTLRELMKWQSEHMYELALDFEVDGETYLLQRDFENHVQSLSGQALPTPLTDAKAIASRLADWLGCSTKALFSSTACVAHDELPDVAEGRRELSDRLQATVTGGNDVSSSSAVQKLEEYLRSLSVGLSSPAKNPGPVRQLRDELDQVENRRQELSAQLAALDGQKARLADKLQEMSRIEEETAHQEEMLQANRRAVDLKDEIGQLMEKYARFRLATEQCDRIRSATRELEELAAFAKAEPDLSQAGDLAARLKAEEQLLEKQEQRYRKLGGGRGRIAPALLAVSIALLVAGMAGFFAAPYLAILAIAGLCGVVYSALQMREYLVARALESELDEHRRAVAGTRTALDQVLQKYGFSSANELAEGRNRYLGATATLAAARTELAATLGIPPDTPPAAWASPWKRFEEKHSLLALEIQQRRDALLQLRSTLLQPIRRYVFDESSGAAGQDSDPAGVLGRLKMDLSGLQRQQSSLRDEISGLKGAIDTAKLDPEELTTLEEKAGELQHRLDILMRRKRVVELAIEGIRQAHSETMVSATVALEAEVGQHVERMARAFLSPMSIDRNTLSISVVSPDSGGPVPITALSRATIDQFYLAARLGLMRLVLNGRKPPILLDDPFVTFDAGRRQRAMELLKEISQGYQVLLFTCSDQYDHFADQVITLPAAGG
ncbi:MAG: AAA family ATPase [Chloroflexi bacterium]|nr:AAA family ATPase [Chloroflexota bacterium]